MVATNIYKGELNMLFVANYLFETTVKEEINEISRI